MDSSLSIILTLVMVGLIVWFIIRGRKNKIARMEKNSPSARQARAIWAWAKVISSQPEDATREWVRVSMELEVHAPGSPASTTSVTWLVQKESLAFIETGQEISLKADPVDPSFVFPNAPWAKIPG